MFGNRKSRFVFVVAVSLLLVSAAWADSLQLKNGSTIKGKYLGGTETEITFQVGSTVQRYAVADVESLTFDQGSRAVVAPRPAAVAPARPATASTAPQLATRPVQATPVTTAASRPVDRIVPAGTRILIRTIDAVDSDHNQVGDKFKASLEEPVIVNEVTIAPKGADVYGRLTQANASGQFSGRSELKLELTGIVINNQTIPLVTGDYSLQAESRSNQTAKRVGGGAALGAVIGAIAGGGKGAAIGAGIGAGAGTAAQVMTKGEQVHVPSESLLEFTLQQDIRRPVAAGGGSR